MAFDPDAATQALINQMLQEDLQLADAQPSTWDYQPPATFPSPPLYQPSEEDLYGNASEEEERSMPEPGEEDYGEDNVNDEIDENNEHEEDDAAEGDEEDAQDEDDNSSIASIPTPEEVLAVTREMERVSRERGVPVAQIYATENECTVNQAVRELSYLQTILNPAPPTSSAGDPPSPRSATILSIESTTAPGLMPPLASNPFTPRFQASHHPTFLPRHLALPNPSLYTSDNSIRPPPTTSSWSTQPQPSSLVDWNALPPREFLDGGLLGRRPPTNNATTRPLARDTADASSRNGSSTISGEVRTRESFPYSTDHLPSNPFTLSHPQRLPPSLPATTFSPSSSIRTTRRPVGIPPPRAPPSPSYPPPSAYPTHPPPSPYARPSAPPPPTYPTYTPPVHPRAFPAPLPQRKRRAPRPSVFQIRDRVVEDEMGTFVLIPWKDAGREEDLEGGGYAGVRRRRKEPVVVEIRVGEEEETLEEGFGGL